MVYDGTSQEIGAHVLLVSFRDEFGGVYTMRIEHASAASCEDGISLTLGNEGASSGPHYHIDMVSGNVIPQIEGQSDTVEAVRDYFVQGHVHQILKTQEYQLDISTHIIIVQKLYFN
jgi:hypothetical protein